MTISEKIKETLVKLVFAFALVLLLVLVYYFNHDAIMPS